MLREMKSIIGRLLPRSAEQFGRDSRSRIRPRHLSCEPLEHRQMLSVTAYAIVDTGQTTFYDNTTVISTPAVGEAFYGQDAQYDGNQASYTLSGDGLTVADDVTGLTWTQSADLVGDTITLDGSASTDTDGTIAAYAWDLDNDGQYDDATGATASFDATAGTFTVGLQVTDNDGAQDTDTATVIVAELTNASPWTHAEVNAEASVFFDDSYVHELNITFDNPDWYNVLYDSHANDADDPYFEADFECDGIAIASVGVRFKGSSSFEIPGVKKSLKIDFDEYDEDNDDLTFLGLKKLNLNNSSKDPTMLREKLFLDYASNFVDGVSRAVHTNVYINGEYWGLYTAVEQVDKTLVQSRFGSDEDGNLFKGAASDEAGDDPQADFGSDLTWLGSDPELYDDYYQLKTNETEYDYSQLVKFIDVLNNTSSEDLPESLEPILDVDNALTAMALNNLFVNLDSYSGAAHNYYLYDRDDTGQFTHLFWDTNESFGRFLMFTSPREDPLELDPFWLPESMGFPPQEAEERPLMENLWAVDTYSAEYLRDLAEMLRQGFDVTTATERIDELADIIRDDVYADTNKMYSNAQFEQNLHSNIVEGRGTIYGLSYFVEQRSAYLDGELDRYADQTDLSLNELMSVNTATVQDESGDYDAWVEIYNIGPGRVGLSGLYLTDDAGDLTKWALPSGGLDDGAFLTLWLDGEAGEGSNHASFSLNIAGGELHLSDGATLIDTVTYDAMADDLSLARVPDGNGAWQSTDRPTPDAANLAGIVSIEPVVLYVNEFMADNDTFIEDPDEAGAYEDWIELYNPGTESIDLGGMYLTDDLSDSVQWQIPAGVTIDAGGYLVVWADKDTDQGDTHASFKLSTDGEAIALYNTDGVTLIDSIEFGVQTTDVSFGRYPDGAEAWGSMSTPTPGAANAPTIVAPTAEVEGRCLFYNNSYWDTATDQQPELDDDTAIATDKWAVAPGGTAGFANYTSYSRGINGIMVDISDLPEIPTITTWDDFFVFAVGNDNTPNNWDAAPDPVEVAVRVGQGTNDSDRVTIVWADHDIQNQWLQVTALANDHTGLTQNDVFYWGNAIGETGDSEDDAFVNAFDSAGIRNNGWTGRNPTPIDFAYDIDRDTFVNAFDSALVREHGTTGRNALKLITVPVVAGAPAQATAVIFAANERSVAGTSEANAVTSLMRSDDTEVSVGRHVPAEAIDDLEAAVDMATRESALHEPREVDRASTGAVDALFGRWSESLAALQCDVTRMSDTRCPLVLPRTMQSRIAATGSLTQTAQFEGERPFRLAAAPATDQAVREALRPVANVRAAQPTRPTSRKDLPQEELVDQLLGNDSETDTLLHEFTADLLVLLRPGGRSWFRHAESQHHNNTWHTMR